MDPCKVALGLPSYPVIQILRFAFGHENGEVVIRDGETGEEYRTICRQAPVWGLTFLYCNLDEPINEDNVKLAIGSWDERLSFYNLEGQMIGRERKVWKHCAP